MFQHFRILYRAAQSQYTISVDTTLIELLGGGTVKGIGHRIQKYREYLGLKQEELAEKVDLSCNYLGAIERDVKTPSFDTLVRIINTLEVSADDIMQDVIDAGPRAKGGELEKRLNQLPAKERKKILRVIEVLIEEAEQ